MSKKSIAAAAVLFLALFALPTLWAQSPSSGKASDEGDSDAADVVVLLDVSQSALPYFNDVTDFVIHSVVKDYLRRGDTFHLLSFGETTQSEISQRVSVESTESDVNDILGKLYLIYPLARYTDLVGALSYLYQYLADLPVSRSKVVIVITDGVHNPPPASPTFGQGPDKVAAEIDAAASRIRANGWPVKIIKLPFPKQGEPGAPASGSAEAQGLSYLDGMAQSLGAEVSTFSAEEKSDLARKSLSLPSATFPGPLGKKDYAFSFPVRFTNGSDSAVGLELDRVRLGEDDILSKKAFLTLQSGKSGTIDVPVLIPDSVPEGETKLAVRLHFAGGVRVSPDNGVLELTLARSPVASFLRSGARIVLFIVVVALLLGAAFALVLIIRRMPRRVEAPIAAAVLQAEEADARTASSAQAAPAASAASAVPAASAARTAAAGRAALQAAAASSKADEGAREAQSSASAAAIAASRKEEAARSAALLAEAANASRAQARAEALGEGASAYASQEPQGKKKGLVRRPAFLARQADDREASAASSAAELSAQKKAETERTLALLAEASGRRQPAKRLSAKEEAEAKAAAVAYAPRVVKPGSVQVELRVAEQNPHVGSRNVHGISAGGSKSVGGGASDFLVFLVSVPRRSAELHFDGEKLCFVPLRPELFPELKGPVEDCLDKEIPMISRSGYPLTLRFSLYEKPADKVNRLLHCIETPGL
jgi:hypothetical protein